jgi:GTP-sensing pleiotropic transcriptional regulator CodY
MACRSKNESEVRQMKTEMTYLELLNKLADDIESDVCIPEHKRKIILEMIARLMAKLFKYSA